MKLFITLILSLFSLTNQGIHNINLNTNSWSISISTKKILASYKNNKMGDLATIETLKKDDILYAERYLCGQGSDNTTSTLKIMMKNKLIYQKSHTNSGLIFSSKIHFSDILKNKNLVKGDILDIYFQLDNKGKDYYSEFVLLGKIKIK